ncbi:3'-5' RNA helicase YTHDC2 [Lamellibrachia satsuma]|nr:3'-5' RNA helicase YTHDC2 [Lamellibrachia satsuma]
MAARGLRGNLSRHSPAINKQSVDPSVPFMRVGMNQPPTNDSPRPSSVGSAHSNQSGSNLSTKAWSKGKNDICVGEELKIAVDIAMERFRLSEEQKELEFPSSLTSTERAYVHRLCQMFGLKSKSKGKGANRYLTISKKDGVHTMHTSAIFHLVRNSRHQIMTLLQRFPLTNKERQDLQPRTDRGQYSDGMGRELNRTTTGRLNNGVPQVPPPRGASDLSAFRLSLPVSQMKDVIVKAINDNRVVLVSGETGSGKTTQVPQMILDECELQGHPCRLFCTQPRRLAALSVAERVAAERGEKIGQTVGYQIRLESRVSPKTLLTFCTNGVLLRTLMGSDNALAMVTHVIVDEVHERDRFNDFLLIALRDILPKYKNLKLILMSAALNVQLFSTYFNNCPVISVPGKLFDVQELFLEDVLKHTGYTNKEMEKYRKELGRVAVQQKQLDDWCKRDVSSPAVEMTSEGSHGSEYDHVSSRGMLVDHRSVELGQEKEELEPWLIKEMDQLVSDVWLTGSEDIFSQIFHLITSENISVDYVHSETGASPLMVAAGRGFFTIVEQLVSLGADVNLQASNDWTALDWAKNFERTDVIELLEAYISVSESVKHDESQLMKQAQTLTAEDRDLLSAYHHSFDDEKVDIELVLCLIYKIHSGHQEG